MSLKSNRVSVKQDKKCSTEQKIFSERIKARKRFKIATFWDLQSSEIEQWDYDHVTVRVWQDKNS